MKLKLLSLALLIISFAGCSGKDEPVPEDEGKILVLMYHKIVNGKATDLYERTLDDFRNDLGYLKQNKVNIICFNDLESVVSSGKMPCGNSAIITVDDGDQSLYSLVKPILLEYRMKATFFLWTEMLGKESFVDWNNVEEMSKYHARDGDPLFVFGSHTYSHAYLLQRKTDFSTSAEYNAFLDYELRESKNLIESHIPGEVSILSLPYGDGAGDPDIMAAAIRNGYKFIRTSKWGAIENPAVNFLAIPSLPVLNNTTTDQIGSYLGI